MGAALVVMLVPVVTLSRANGLHGSMDGGKPLPPTLQFRPLSREAAVAFNRAVPFANEPRQPASSFILAGDPATRSRALECLTAAIYYEAAGEVEEGQQAVAQVVLNRVRHPAFPASVCAVVYQGSNLPTGCQFSFTCDGSLQREPDAEAWNRAKRVAESALSGFVYTPVGWSTHYHADWVVPYWASSLDKSVQIGAHIFYQWPGVAERKAQFRQAYSAEEAQPSVLRTAALIAHGIWPAPDDARQGPLLTIRTDVEMESASIEGLIASSSGLPTSAFEKDIRAVFANQPAVSQSLGNENAKAASTSGHGQSDLTSAGQKPDTLVEQTTAATPDKVDTRVSGHDVGEFIRAHRGFYANMAARAQLIAAQAAAQWSTYTGLAVRSRRVILSPAAGLSDDSCRLPIAEFRDGSLLAWPTTELSPAELFLRAGFAKDQLDSTPTSASQRTRLHESQRDIVLAVFARIAALSGHKEEAAMLLRDAQLQGDSRAPLYYQRLALFERHRDRFPTLREFLPYLVHDVAEQRFRAADVVVVLAATSPCATRDAALVATSTS